MTTPTKSQTLTSKEKTKKVKKGKNEANPFIKYEDPDLKVVIRLLPPNMPESEFVNQLPSRYNPSTKDTSVLDKFYYKKGRPSMRPFEEPVFSRAYFQFKLHEEAHRFKSEMKSAVFEDANSGDQVQCEMMKPFFGSVVDLHSDNNPGQILQDPIYVLFLALRSSNPGQADLLKIMKALTTEKKKKKREKNRLKRATKEKDNELTNTPAQIQKQTKAATPATEKEGATLAKKEKRKKDSSHKDKKNTSDKKPDQGGKTPKPSKKPTQPPRKAGVSESEKATNGNNTNSKTKETVNKKKPAKSKKAKAAGVTGEQGSINKPSKPTQKPKEKQPKEGATGRK